ncbi:MAG: hypothetical protein H0X67_20985 [Acidobacteria bacterium]|nr:hypothetical protein [Acidobacteriota bacterium]
MGIPIAYLAIASPQVPGEHRRQLSHRDGEAEKHQRQEQHGVVRAPCYDPPIVVIASRGFLWVL